MKKTFSFVIIIFFILSVNVFGQNWLWAKCASGTSFYYDEGNSVAADISGNLYFTGGFTSQYLIFGTDTLTKINGWDVFLAKYNSSGTLLWAKGAGGNGDDEGYSVATDVSGNAYVTGFFDTTTVTFGTHTITSVGNHDVFLVKYNAAGKVVWAKSAGGTDIDEGRSVATDVFGNVYIAGYFNSPTITFGTHTLNNTAIGPPSYDAFLVKYDTAGNVIWAKNFIGGWNDEALGVATDAAGNIFTTGYFNSSSLTVGTFTLTGGSYGNAFLAKYDSSGVAIWANNIDGAQGNNVITDASKNIYVTGPLSSPSLIFGTYTLTNLGSRDAFLVKYNPSGNPLWAKDVGGTWDDVGYGLATDASNNVYLSGGFTSDSISLGTITLHNPIGSTDPLFLIKYDSLGNVLCASVLPSGGDDQSGLATDNSGNVYVGGDFMISPFVIGNDTLTVPAGENIFVAKYHCDNLSTINKYISSQEIDIYPNPSSNNITVQSSAELGVINIYNALGEKIIEARTKSQEASIDIANLPAGIYTVQVLGKYMKLVKE